MTKAQVADVGERIVWTLLEVLTADGIVQFMGWDTRWIVPVAAILAAVKSTVATAFGNGSAATLPARLEPVPAIATPPTDSA